MMEKSNYKIFGFAGRKRSGKGVLSNVIKDAEPQGKVQIITIANYLKYLCCDLLDMDIDDLNLKKDNGYTFSIYPDNRWCNIINKKTNIDKEIIKQEIGNIEFTNIRQMLQIIGTDLIRKYNENWHVNCMINEIKEYGTDYIFAVDDVRFPNERKALKDLGGEIFFIIRPNYFDVSNHISEISLTWSDFAQTRVIINDLTLDDFQTYFKASYVNGFNDTYSNPIYLSAMPEYVGSHSLFPSEIFPFEKQLGHMILQQNLRNPRFLRNGIIRYVCNDDCNTFDELNLHQPRFGYGKKVFTFYNPLINENLKRLM